MLGVDCVLSTRYARFMLDQSCTVTFSLSYWNRKTGLRQNFFTTEIDGAGVSFEASVLPRPGRLFTLKVIIAHKFNALRTQFNEPFESRPFAI